MIHLLLRRVGVIFLMLWLPFSQVLGFGVPVCPVEMGGVGHSVSADGLRQAVAEITDVPASDNPIGIGCMLAMDCRSCHGWAFPSSIDLVAALPVPFVATFNSPYAAQFEPAVLERPPRSHHFS